MEWMLLEMIDILHWVGYERLRATFGMAPSGCAWRLTLTHAANTEPNPYGAGERVKNREEAWHYTSAQPTPFDTDLPVSTSMDLAEAFLTLYPEIAAKAKGEDKEYVEWYKGVLEKTTDCLPVMYADWWDMPPDKILTTKDGVTIPNPPPFRG